MQKRIAGFTLIELLVVVGIIVVLSTIGMVSYRNANQLARDNKRKADIETVRQALVLFKQENTAYPPDGGFSTVVSSLVTGNYLSQPAPSGTEYTYDLTNSGQGFCICADLETENKGNSNSSCNFNVIPANKDYYCAVEP